MALWGATLLVISLAVLKGVAAQNSECPRLCRGLYFQQMPFQCNGTIEKLTLQCSITSKTPPKIRLFLIREGGNTSQPFHTEKIVDSRWNFTVHPINENYQPGDTIAYYFNSQEEANCTPLNITYNLAEHCTGNCPHHMDLIYSTGRGCLASNNPNIAPSGNQCPDNNTTTAGTLSPEGRGNESAQSACGDQTAAVAALATLLVIIVVGCGAAWAVFGAVTIRRWRRLSGKGGRMSYIVTTTQAGEATYEDYVEPDGVLQGPPAANTQQQDAEYSIVQPMDHLRGTPCNHTSLPEAQQGDDIEYSVLEEEDPYRAPANSVNAIFHEMSSKRGTYRNIAPREVDLQDELGQGQYGMVYRARWSSPSGQKEAAVKCLHGKQEEEKRVRLLQEAFTMGQFKHPHVVQLYGVVNSKDTVMLVMELLSGGDLRNFLLNKAETGGPCSLAPLQLLMFCQDVAAAMVYLSLKGFIHRDLAARNILLDYTNQCKIADFGMSRDLEEDYYYTQRGGQIPVKWTAPEAILFHKYTTKSDVWSYGMVMYEIWSLGRKPFAEHSVDQVIKEFNTGYCQPPPPRCPRGIYSIMVKCWNPDHHSRPSFKEIHSELTSNTETLLAWSGEDEGTPPHAATLGAQQSEEANLYKDLQYKYKQSPPTE